MRGTLGGGVGGQPAMRFMDVVFMEKNISQTWANPWSNRRTKREENEMIAPFSTTKNRNPAVSASADHVLSLQHRKFYRVLSNIFQKPHVFSGGKNWASPLKTGQTARTRTIICDAPNLVRIWGDIRHGMVAYVFLGGRYCWWLKSGVNQLRLVVDPIIYRVLYILSVVGNGISSINSMIGVLGQVCNRTVHVTTSSNCLPKTTTFEESSL